MVRDRILRTCYYDKTIQSNDTFSINTDAEPDASEARSGRRVRCYVKTALVSCIGGQYLGAERTTHVLQLTRRYFKLSNSSLVCWQNDTCYSEIISSVDWVLLFSVRFLATNLQSPRNSFTKMKPRHTQSTPLQLSRRYSYHICSSTFVPR